MKCDWCQGNMVPDFDDAGHVECFKCLHCGRSEDFDKECRIKYKQSKPHHNWHGYIEDPDMRNRPRKTGWDKKLKVGRNR